MSLVASEKEKYETHIVQVDGIINHGTLRIPFKNALLNNLAFSIMRQAKF